MLNRLVIGMAGLASGIMLTVLSRLGHGVSLVNVADESDVLSRAAPAWSDRADGARVRLTI